MSALHPFSSTRGLPQPLGASLIKAESPDKCSINFALFHPDASGVILCLFKDKSTVLYKIPLDSKKNKTGNVWHILLHDLPKELIYGYQILDKQTPDSNDIQPPLYFLDPYAKGVASENSWAKEYVYHPLGLLPDPLPFDWEDESPPNLAMQDLIIYEMHVRGFTYHPSGKSKNPGTFQAIKEKIPYLLELGVNALELLPIHEFNEKEYQHLTPSGKKLCNYWGYSTVNFFSLMNRYGSSNYPHENVQEFKMLIKELHKNGIEVILDVVFNHTAEGNELGPRLSFKAMANSTYYMLQPDGTYSNYSGCGNTLNGNHPVVIEMILESLRYWVIEMHVDGFRFDLASALSRGMDGEPMEDSPLVKAISLDPVLAKTKLIAEAWDAVGLYQIGRFFPHQIRWSEWNGPYRDTVRKFIKGTAGVKGEFATRICGSQDLYGGRNPPTSINFITAHDGFSLNDLVSYNQKHNNANGEENRDGCGFNDSWNCGTEGTTSNKKIIALRNRQMRNFHLALMVSQGVPMLVMGDEYGHTKKGNNNTWCQDNELNWFLWDQLKINEGFYRFYRLMIDFRKRHSILKRSSFLTDQDVQWHGLQLNIPKWDEDEDFVAFTLRDHEHQESLYIAFNAGDRNLSVELPKNEEGISWYWVVNTSKPSPEDFIEMTKTQVTTDTYAMMPHSAILLKSYKV